MGQGGRIYTDRVTMNPGPGAPGDGTVNFFAVEDSPDTVLDADLGDRAWQIGSTNKWVCNGGTSWSLDDGGGAGGVLRQFTWALGGADDAANGVYTAFSDAHAAAAAAWVDTSNGLVELYVINLTGGGSNDILLDEVGAFGMAGIKLIGVSYRFDGVSPRLLVDDGATFSNLAYIETLQIVYRGSAPMLEVVTDSANPTTYWWGPGVTVSNFGSAPAPFLELSGDGTLTLNLMENGELSTGEGVGAVNVLETATLELQVFSATIVADVFDGAVGSTVRVTRQGASQVDAPTVYPGTYAVLPGLIPYEATLPTDWSEWGSGLVPATTTDAIDRLVAGVASGSSGLDAQSTAMTGAVMPLFTGAGFTKTGAAVGCTNVEASFALVGAGGIVLSQRTSGVINEDTYITEPSTVYSADGQPQFTDVFWLPTVTSIRFFSGFTGALGIAILASDNPADQYIGLQYSTARGDTTFQIARRNAGAQVLVDTLITPDPLAVYRFVVDMTTTRAVVSLYLVTDEDGNPPINTLLYQGTFTGATVWYSGAWTTGLRALVAAVRSVNRYQTFIAAARYLPVTI